ncbi:MAG: alpha-glucuronidase [Prevotella sp.]
MKKSIILTLCIALFMGTAFADDGSALWLRAKHNKTKAIKASFDSMYRNTIVEKAADEINRYWRGDEVRLIVDKELVGLKDGFRLEEGTIKAACPEGIYYGAQELIRRQEATLPTATGDFVPAFALRILNHWDNLDGTIERGYAGHSIWIWDEIEGKTAKKMKCSSTLREKIEAYARANASIGINGSVLNNVNASPKMLSTEYINKVKVIADILREYGIKTYLSVNFASPMALGNLKTADPLDPKVAKWWKAKAKQIYSIIPDFGGFLVKANSEGQPGPGDYDRTHADGANMLADALKPYGGIVMWRCFVYGNKHKGEDRVKQAVTEFLPVDGEFRSNVILQAKNGPLDFQPREPYAPVFDEIKKTPLMAELQITQEYLGHSQHLVFLAPMWKEFFSYVKPESMVGIAGVANIGDDINWCGHHFAQANWYAFGRLAWNPALDTEEIACEWLRQTFTTEKAFVEPMTTIMAESREACVDYMMPLGLHHIFKADHHYGPEPDGNQAHFPEEWKPVYYHKATKQGVGFERSSRGTNATSQYREPYRSLYDNVDTCPAEFLLWFHHLPWNFQLKNGRTLWGEMTYRYNRGVAAVESYVATWHQMRPYIDAQRYEEVDTRLKSQEENAREWRDTCLNYFRQFAE